MAPSSTVSGSLILLDFEEKGIYASYTHTPDAAVHRAPRTAAQVNSKDSDNGAFIAIDLAGCKITVARYADIFQPFSRMRVMGRRDFACGPAFAA